MILLGEGCTYRAPDVHSCIGSVRALCTVKAPIMWCMQVPQEDAPVASSMSHLKARCCFLPLPLASGRIDACRFVQAGVAFVDSHLVSSSTLSEKMLRTPAMRNMAPQDGRTAPILVSMELLTAGLCCNLLSQALGIGCIIPGCPRTRMYNYEMPALYCALHKEEGMTDLLCLTSEIARLALTNACMHRTFELLPGVLADAVGAR